MASGSGAHERGGGRRFQPLLGFVAERPREKEPKSKRGSWSVREVRPWLDSANTRESERERGASALGTERARFRARRGEIGSGRWSRDRELERGSCAEARELGGTGLREGE
ncbi:hypothetical protein MA16_Dca011173 [Dendrobium catenatum]|uniref:Uncharacterized protein n=1 Tax=Dendrobium catenatum TaxID=906689 RepID=A0A2I0VIF8_9ASPA|nr:hypothetical protein MA16_Dca011173 [Dendrobium catenatum]